MLAAFQGLSWLQRWKGTSDSRSERTRPRRHRARFRVESLEPRWLLSTMGTSGDEAEPVSTLLTVSVDYSSAISSSSAMYQVAVPGDWDKIHLLPDAKTVQVNGSLSLGMGSDVLEVRLESGVTSFIFALKSAWDNQPVVETLQLFDTNFKEFASYGPTDPAQTFVFALNLWSDKPSSFFVKIGLSTGIESSSVGAGVNSYPYTLEVTRNWLAPPVLCGPSPPALPQNKGNPYESYPSANTINISSGPVVVVSPPPPVGPDANPGSPDPNANLQPPAGQWPLPYEGPSREESSGAISLTVAVGRLPMRSTAPLGGVLAAPDSVPPVDQHEGAQADLAAFDPARDLENVDLRPRQVVPVDEREAVQVVTLRGPGGLPLLATALIAGSTATVRTDSNSTTAQDKGGADETESVEATRAPGAVVTQVQATKPSFAADDQPSSTSSSQTRASKRPLRSSVVPGLTLAFALGVGLVLPDLVASLQFLDPKRPLLRLRLIRRAFKGR
ncbi:hypothetical protein [Singulisphaera acidiphila]|nr:hypothetical protein [Singulisphaera acidiphila]